MPKYLVRFYKASDREPVVDFLANEIQDEHEAKAYNLLRHLQANGAYRNPYVEKLRGDIWELKVDYSGVWLRLLFSFGPESTIIVLHAFKKKTNKTPAREIHVAQERADRLKRG